MFAKIVVLIVSLGVCACTLLALRQARLQAANELADARLRVRTIDERISMVRTEIAPHVTPIEVRQMTRELQDLLGPLVPMVEPHADAGSTSSPLDTGAAAGRADSVAGGLENAPEPTSAAGALLVGTGTHLEKTSP